jgi:uncharacterized protein YbcI
VINLQMDSRAVVRFYNQRGPAEVASATIKEGKQAVKMTRPALRDVIGSGPMKSACG